jgi:hypothetical protein
MTDDSIEANAQALMDEVKREHPTLSDYTLAVFAAQRAIEQHEAFKQEVSDVMTYIKELYPTLPRNFHRFIIIPKPKPDPFEQTLKIMDAVMERLEAFRAALDARGLEIRSKNDD